MFKDDFLFYLVLTVSGKFGWQGLEASKMVVSDF